MRLGVVTATTDPARAASCLRSWAVPADVPFVIVLNTDTAPANGVPEIINDLGATHITAHSYLGTVPAFRVGVDYLLDQTDVDVLICLHDDVEMLDPTWLQAVARAFERRPQCGLAGFGGAIGLGADDIYKTPYDPMQLARIGFRSNLVDAEVHGLRSLLSERVACLDGFSQIGRREFFTGESSHRPERPWSYLEDHGIRHHLYDGLLGALAARHGWETWFLPVRCRHYGGQTAVGDAGYQAWAKEQIHDGDLGFWQESHRIGYDLFRDVLPLRV